jgi:hypothetical protein
MIRLIRLLAGVLIAPACFQLWSAQGSGGWLSLVVVVAISMLTTWVTGPPWGWVVTAGWIVLGGDLGTARAIQGATPPCRVGEHQP